MRQYGSKRVNPARAAAQMAFVSAAMRVPEDVPREQITLQLAEETPSLNLVRSMHWATVERMKRYWAGLLLEALSAQHSIHLRHHDRKARVRVERVARGTLDYDNLVGGAKHTVLDRLKERGLIVDDSPQWITCEYDQRRCLKGELPHTIVKITWETP